MDRTLAGSAAIATVEAALEFVGGTAYIRPHPLERMFRDVQAARFHPIGPAQQRMLAGRVALGLDINDSISEEASPS
jgi:acyl-CoA dehydrogenase